MNRTEFRKNRHINSLFFGIILVIFLLFTNNLFAQKEKKVDYSQASNILNPDTLVGDNKRIFWHFVKLTHEEVKQLEPIDILNEFTKLHIFREERARFVAAYGFTRITMTGHKKSCENWAYFDFLKPKN